MDINDQLATMDVFFVLKFITVERKLKRPVMLGDTELGSLRFH